MTAEIEALVAEYNQVEAEQTARLRRLFELLNARKFYRRVRFSNDSMWSNCWGLPEKIWFDRFIAPQTRLITEIDPGAEG